MIMDLVKPNDPVLKKKCIPFHFDSPPVDPHKLIRDLKESMIHHKGIGLSACQVGLPYRVFVAGSPEKPEEILSFFNPKIVWTSEDNILIEEGCLSFPGLYIRIKRPTSVRIRSSNANGVVATNVFDDISARTILHEYDHMDGITFHRRASQLSLHMALKQQKKIQRLRRKAGEMSYV